VIWADCISLLAQDDVVLVTADKAFYHEQTYAKGLSQSLQREVQELQRTIRVLPAIADLLDALKAPIEIDPDALQAAFIAEFSKSVLGSLERHGFTLGERSSCTYKVYATEDPTVLFLDFAMEIQCIDARGDGRTEAALHLKGDGRFSRRRRRLGIYGTLASTLNFKCPTGLKARCVTQSYTPKEQ
jgi:hypothetical protein